MVPAVIKTSCCRLPFVMFYIRFEIRKAIIPQISSFRSFVTSTRRQEHTTTVQFVLSCVLLPVSFCQIKKITWCTNELPQQICIRLKIFYLIIILYNECTDYIFLNCFYSHLFNWKQVIHVFMYYYIFFLLMRFKYEITVVICFCKAEYPLQDTKQ